mgnify:CR=1 FL=1
MPSLPRLPSPRLYDRSSCYERTMTATQPTDQPTETATGAPGVPLGVFGGSGFYEFLDDAEEHVVDTPYGWPEGPVGVGWVAGNRVAVQGGPGGQHPYLYPI